VLKDSCEGGTVVPAAHLFVKGNREPCNLRPLQIKLHIERSRDGILAIRRNFAEAKRAIHGDRIFHHGLDGIETHALVTDLPRFSDHMLGERAAEALTSKGRVFEGSIAGKYQRGGGFSV
jgi:hypothetical protein